MATPKDRRYITSLVRGLEVLRCFESGEESLGNLQIAERCKLPPSTVARLTYTLVESGFLYKDARDSRYRLGPGSLAIGGVSLTRLKFRESARAALQALADEVGLQIAVGVRDEFSMLYFETCHSTSLVRLRLDVGSKIPLATTAMGRACLASMSSTEREAVLARMKRLLYKANWPQIESGVVQGIESVARVGCACSFGEWRPEIFGIAVPLVLGGGMPNFAVSAAGAAHSRSAAYYMEVVLPRLLAATHQIKRDWR